MKILIAGCGMVGELLIKQLLAERNDVTIIDSNPKKLERLVEQYDVMAIHGNCASMEALKQAGAESADLMIAATGSDEINMLCSVTAHGLNPSIHTIARIRNPEYADQAYSRRDIFGLSLSFNPEKQAALEIERLLKLPGFLKRDAFAKGRVEIVELKIDQKSKLCGVPLVTMYSIIKCRVLVCAVLRDGKAIMPGGQFTLEAGDRIFVSATRHDLALLMKNLGIVTHKVRSLIIAGGGTVSYYLADALADDHINVTMIEKDADRCQKLAELLPHVNIIHGHPANQDLLESEGLADCDALVTLTDTDEQNVIISMFGNNRGVSQIVTKLDRMENAKILNDLPVGSVISPKHLCSNVILRYVRALQARTGGALTIHTMADGQAEALEFPVDESTPFCGVPLKELRLKKNLLIVCINRGSSTEIPRGDSTYRPGDSVVVVTEKSNLILQLGDIFE